MGRDWSKAHRQTLAHQARRSEMDAAGYAHDLEAAPPPSKADLRAEAAALIARDSPKVQSIATVFNLRCPKCRHKGLARVPKGRPLPQFKCSRCGTRM